MSDPKPPDMAAELGQNIRALRKSKALTLQQLAHSAGLSVSFISAIERGKKKPSLSALQQISTALGMDVGWFFNENAGDNRLERRHIVRKELRRKIAYSKLAEAEYLGEIQYLLSPHIDGQLAMVLIEVEPGCSSGDDLFTHPGEEVGYVLSGELTLVLKNKQFRLKAGDSFGFEGNIPHRYVNNGDEKLCYLIINTPVAFGVRNTHELRGLR